MNTTKPLFTNSSELLGSWTERYFGNTIAFTAKEQNRLSHPIPVALSIASIALSRFLTPQAPESGYPTRANLKNIIRDMTNKYFALKYMSDADKETFIQQMNEFFSPELLRDIDANEFAYQKWKFVNNYLSDRPVPVRFYTEREKFLADLTEKSTKGESPNISEDNLSQDNLSQDNPQTRPRAWTTGSRKDIL